MLIGLFLDYMCAIFFGGWLATRNPAALFAVLLFGSTSVLFLYMGIQGFLLRPWREMRVLEDRIVLKGEWRFDEREIVIPLNTVWKLYANLENDFPRCFLVWRDDRGRCRCLGFNKDDLRDFETDFGRLKNLVPVDTESYAMASFVRKDVKENLGCEPAW